MIAEKVTSHFRSLNALTPPTYRRQARYTEIVAPIMNTVAPSPWNAEMYCHWLLPTSNPTGAVAAAGRPTLAIAPRVTSSSVASEGSIFRILPIRGVSLATTRATDGRISYIKLLESPHVSTYVVL